LALPDADALSALRAWHESLSSREAVKRFSAARRAPGKSARSVIGSIRRQVCGFARSRHGDDLPELSTAPPAKARLQRTPSPLRSSDWVWLRFLRR